MFKKALFGSAAGHYLYRARAQANGDIDWMQFAGSEITILMPEHPVLDGMRSVMDDFEAATGITVNVEALAENLYFDRMEVALRADEGVMDVYMVPMDSTAFTQWSNGLIHPLTPFLEDDHMTAADYDFADFPAGFTQATQYPPGDMDAQDYAIPGFLRGVYALLEPGHRR